MQCGAFGEPDWFADSPGSSCSCRCRTFSSAVRELRVVAFTRCSLPFREYLSHFRPLYFGSHSFPANLEESRCLTHTARSACREQPCRRRNTVSTTVGNHRQ